jgi:tRNA (guanine-N7-)-methyltransferase
MNMIVTKNSAKIKSYSRKIGKNLTTLSKSLLGEVLPKYQATIQKINIMSNLTVEVGFGDGQNIYNMALQNPEKNFLGIEAYLNGVCNLLKLCKEQPLNNLLIYPEDADSILQDLPDNFIDAFYVFFPDPWPKARQNKRRFLNNERINLIERKLKPCGKINFITDVKGYFTTVLKILGDAYCQIINADELEKSFKDYKPTKYHQKALLNGNGIFALTYTKKESTCG